MTGVLLLLRFVGCVEPESEEPPPIAVEPTPVPADVPIETPAELKGHGQTVVARARDLVLLADGVEVHVPYLEARMVPVGEMVDLEDPNSFTIEVEAIEVRFPEQTLGAAFVRGMDKGEGEPPPFKDVTVTTEGETLVLKGHARALGLPFTFRVNPIVTEEGTLALVLEQVHVLGIGVKGFVGAFEHEIENAANKEQGRLLDVEKDLLTLDPFPFAGPPEVHAAFRTVELRERSIVARLGDAPDAKDALPGPGLVLKGGVIRNDRTVLFDVTLALLPRDGGPLVIDPDRMNEQISTGFSKIEPERIALHLAPLSELDPP
jgi:hypothetical protein